MHRRHSVRWWINELKEWTNLVLLTVRCLRSVTQKNLSKWSQTRVQIYTWDTVCDQDTPSCRYDWTSSLGTAELDSLATRALNGVGAVFSEIKGRLSNRTSLPRHSNAINSYTENKLWLKTVLEMEYTLLEQKVIRKEDFRRSTEITLLLTGVIWLNGTP